MSSTGQTVASLRCSLAIYREVVTGKTDALGQTLHINEYLCSGRHFGLGTSMDNFQKSDYAVEKDATGMQ